MFANVDEWLGCLDTKMGTALWQCSAQYNVIGSGLISPDAVFEVYTPDDYCLRPPELLAFLDIFGLTLILNDNDPCQPYILQVNSMVVWSGVELLHLQYPAGDFSDAPCTQQTFP